MASMPSSGAPEWVRAARDLYLVAIAVFVVNIVIGILNGADAVEFDANAGPLAGKVCLPAAAGTEENGGGIGRFWNHPGDDPAQLAGRIHGVEKRQDVFWS